MSEENRLILEVIPALTALLDLSQVELGVRASSSQMRIAYEVVYLINVFSELSLQSIFGGIVYENRTADLNYFTTIFINFGILGGAIVFGTLGYLFVKSKAKVRSAICFVSIAFVSGAFLKPLLTFLILLLLTDRRLAIKK